MGGRRAGCPGGLSSQVGACFGVHRSVKCTSYSSVLCNLGWSRLLCGDAQQLGGTAVHGTASTGSYVMGATARHWQGEMFAGRRIAKISLS